MGGMGLAAVAGANPLLLIVAVVALGRAFHNARQTGDYKEFTDGLARGGICTGAVLLATKWGERTCRCRPSDRHLCGHRRLEVTTERELRGNRAVGDRADQGRAGRAGLCSHRRRAGS